TSLRLSMTVLISSSSGLFLLATRCLERPEPERTEADLWRTSPKWALPRGHVNRLGYRFGVPSSCRNFRNLRAFRALGTPPTARTLDRYPDGSPRRLARGLGRHSEGTLEPAAR